MLHARRFLPSLSLLAAFEAAARTGSVTVAARELDLTQSAVSRQIRALESQLGVELFVRERQTIRLTLAGDAYAREIREALRRISAASLNLRANPDGGTLTLAVLPAFGSRWLMPRLAGFLEHHRGMSVNLVTRLSPFDFKLDSIDAAIHFGDAVWPGAELTPLMGERIMPCCSPQFRDRHQLATPGDFLQAPLLHLTSRPDAWEQWLIGHDVPEPTVHGMLFDQFSAAAQAAVAGLGVALLPRFLFEEELRRGDLVEAFADGEIDGGGRYFLACPTERLTYPPLAAFRDWIAEVAKDEGKMLSSLSGSF